LSNLAWSSTHKTSGLPCTPHDVALLECINAIGIAPIAYARALEKPLAPTAFRAVAPPTERLEQALEVPWHSVMHLIHYMFAW